MNSFITQHFLSAVSGVSRQRISDDRIDDLGTDLKTQHPSVFFCLRLLLAGMIIMQAMNIVSLSLLSLSLSLSLSKILRK